MKKSEIRGMIKEELELLNEANYNVGNVIWQALQDIADGKRSRFLIDKLPKFMTNNEDKSLNDAMKTIKKFDKEQAEFLVKFLTIYNTKEGKFPKKVDASFQQVWGKVPVKNWDSVATAFKTYQQARKFILLSNKIAKVCDNYKSFK